jgi:ferredoxin
LSQQDARVEIQIDKSACRGATACLRRAPGTFSLGDDGKSQAAKNPADDEATIRAAAAACPFFAIEVREVAD